jgi:hypothetical protein
MSTPTLCATVDLIFSQSSSCLGGMTPGCPFRPLGKERGGQTTAQSFQIGALTTHPLPPPACVADRPAAPDPAGSDGKTIRQGALSAQLRRTPPPSAMTSLRRLLPFPSAPWEGRNPPNAVCPRLHALPPPALPLMDGSVRASARGGERRLSLLRLDGERQTEVVASRDDEPVRR